MADAGSPWPVICPKCGAERPDVLERMADSRTRYSCPRCDHVWVEGVAQPVPAARASKSRRAAPEPYDVARGRFPKADQVEPGVRVAVEEKKRIFLSRYPHADPKGVEFFAKYRAIFSREDLPHAAPSDLHLFANSSTGAHPGQMTVFNDEWNLLGPEEGAKRVREAIEYLLYGPDRMPLEDRLTDVIEPDSPIGMKGWKEALHTKVLCVVYPSRFIPILTYSSTAGGKREIIESIWGLRLPHPKTSSRSRGRLITWSNDLLLELAGDGFDDAQHVAQFVWTIKHV